MKKLLIVFLVLMSGVIYGVNDRFIIDEPTDTCSYSVGASTTTPFFSSMSGTPIPSIGTVPTPDTIDSGDFLVEFNMYDDGGMNTRIIIGFFDFLNIGVSENIDDLIGSGPVNFNIPGAYLKITLLPNYDKFDLAVGFDNFGFGDNGNYVLTNGESESIYGFYVNGAVSYNVLGARNIFTFGIRAPLLPGEFRKMRNSSLFLGATLGSEVLYAGVTLEHMYLDFTRGNEILPTLSLNFAPAPKFKVSVSVQYEFEEELFNRLVGLSYVGSF